MTAKLLLLPPLLRGLERSAAPKRQCPGVSEARREKKSFQHVANKFLAAVRPTSGVRFLVRVNPRFDKSLKMSTAVVRAKVNLKYLGEVEGDHLPKFSNSSTFRKHI